MQNIVKRNSNMQGFSTLKMKIIFNLSFAYKERQFLGEVNDTQMECTGRKLHSRFEFQARNTC